MAPDIPGVDERPPGSFMFWIGRSMSGSSLTIGGSSGSPEGKGWSGLATKQSEEVKRLRSENRPTIPTLLGEEKKANVFLRADEASVAAGVRMKGRSAAEVFGELRERKNKS